jgi:hypothetical protein
MIEVKAAWLLCRCDRKIGVAGSVLLSSFRAVQFMTGFRELKASDKYDYRSSDD